MTNTFTNVNPNLIGALLKSKGISCSITSDLNSSSNLAEHVYVEYDTEITLTEEELVSCRKENSTSVKTNAELEAELASVKEELADVTERLAQQQEMSSMTMAALYGGTEGDEE